jgi:hypothetical protein
MAYFKQLPNLLYASKIRKSGFGEYEHIKNIFRRYKLRDDVKAIASQFYKYEIPLGFTPEQVAEDIYDDPDLYWIVLIINDVVDIYSQWPVDQQSLQEFVYEKYDSPDGIHHYETYERYDSNNNIVMKQGLYVTPGWEHEYLYSADPIVKRNLTFGADAFSVTNYEYEEERNDNLRTIEVIHPNYVGGIVADFEEQTKYEENSDLVDDITKKTAIDLVRKYY